MTFFTIVYFVVDLYLLSAIIGTRFWKRNLPLRIDDPLPRDFQMLRGAAKHIADHSRLIDKPTEFCNLTVRCHFAFRNLLDGLVDEMVVIFLIVFQTSLTKQ
jgi:hypothetical protein